MGSLRYRRPYWMLGLRAVKHWRVYMKTAPGFMRTELLYQAWLGGLDRPYTRPRCSHRSPTWLTKKRLAMEPPHLTAETPVERLYVEFRIKYFNYRGRLRPASQDLNDILELVERPLDLSYACRVLSHMTNDFLVPLDPDAFLLFVDACARVDRKDVMLYALENATVLGFTSIDENCRKYIEQKQTWYTIREGKYIPEAENIEMNNPEDVARRLAKESVILDSSTGGSHQDISASSGNVSSEISEEEELRQLEEELRKLGTKDE